MKIIYMKEKIKIIKDNFNLSNDKLCKKLNMTTSEVHGFCARNNIKIPPSIKKESDKIILNLIAKNPNLSMGLLVRKAKCSQMYLSELLNSKGIVDDRFTKNINAAKNITNIRKQPIKLCTTRVKRKLAATKKPTTKNKSVVYTKLNHEQLNEILLATNNVDNKFKRDIGGLGIGEALCIKKENWIIENVPYFYFTKITNGTGMKVKVREIEGNIYVIRTK